MNYQIFSENEWVYPDTCIEEANEAILYSARNTDVCFQVLTDKILEQDLELEVQVRGLECSAVVYQLLPARVEENSAPDMFTTLDYESVKDFVTRQAPFDVYEITRPVKDGKLWAGRGAFYIRLNIPKNATCGQQEGSIVLTIGGEDLSLPVSLKIYRAQIPALKDAAFHMNNWIFYDEIVKQHGVECCSEEYFDLLEIYFKNQLDMRNDYLMLPSGEPICDAQGKVVDFDFSHAIEVGRLALRCGYKYVLGGFVARFKVWDEAEQYLLWDEETGVTTIEGYRQLKLYFTRAWECIRKNGWEQCYMQCLVDEPQFPNSLAYRALSGICRSCMPGVKVNDPVETTDIAGAIDVWVVKQAVYEKYIDTYRALQDMGEEMWLYTCGFPGGATMNRIIDLPLTVSRLPMWLCYHYKCQGFLHWGYNKHNATIEKETCFIVGENLRYPAGNSFVVYPALNGGAEPWYSVRGHAQRRGACDYELFAMLERKYSYEDADALIQKVCQSFDEYDAPAALFDEVRHELLELLG